MDDGSPEVYPTDKPEVIGWVGLLLYDVINGLVKDSDRAWILFKLGELMVKE